MISKHLKILLTIINIFFAINILLSENQELYFNQSDSLIQSDLNENIKYSAKDSIIYDLENNIINLYNESVIKYENIELYAYYISINFNNNTVYAEGKKDSVGKITQKPIFFESNKKYISETIKYNFKTQKGITTKLLTKEGESFLHGEKVKKLEEKTHYLSKGLYTTCDLDTPHFYIKSNKIKLIESDKIIAGTSNLVIADIHTPFFIPFGIFPLNTKKSSGILLPSYGESISLGFNLRNLGYYFSINDYMDLTLTSDIFMRGSWRLGASSNYIKRYKYKGNLNINFSNTKIGEKYRSDYSLSKDFSLKWSHQQDPKSKLNSRFSGSINIVSRNYSRNNLFTNSQDYLSNNFSSNISYSKKWSGKPYNLALNLRHSQNTLNKTVDLTVPELTFTINRINLFKKNDTKSSFLNNLGLSYTLNSKSRLNRPDSLIFNNIINNLQTGVRHNIPISTSFNILKYFNISPSINYTERWYFKKINQNWNNILETVESDTTKGFYALREFNLSMNFNTKIYGLFDFSKIAIRHILTPSISLNYRPDFSQKNWGIYSSTQIDTLGAEQTYSYFQGGVYGYPPQGKYGNISFSFKNNVEMKLKEKENKKIKLIENLSLSGNYNIAADSLNLSPIYIKLRAKIYKDLNFQINTNIDPYKIDNGVRINELVINDNQIGRLTYANINFNINLKNQNNESEKNNNFNVPWNLNIYYALNYAKPYDEKEITQSINFDGNIDITKKWKIKYQSGFDVKNKDFTFTKIDIYRDLHCWEMIFNWIPFGNQKSYNFVIRVKSSILQDLKLSKKKNVFDANYLTNF